MVWPILAVISFVIAPARGWWFPGPSVSPLGASIDNLFYLILFITSFTFIGTHIALGYVLWRYASAPGRKSWFTHGSHTLEVIWTIIPAVILLFIALYQMDVWAQFRIQGLVADKVIKEPVAEVSAHQFGWRIRYPAIGKTLQDLPQPDDLYAINDLHVPFNRQVSIRLRTDDVQHAFFLPHLRVKQDAVPGLVIPVWFQADKVGTYELVCAELCGWGHYKMRGQMVSETEENFREYLRKLAQSQFDDGVSASAEDRAPEAAQTTTPPRGDS
jgi:cytochrome c oxidase subunit 2